jgi:hypothetical protein
LSFALLTDDNHFAVASVVLVPRFNGKNDQSYDF